MNDAAPSESSAMPHHDSGSDQDGATPRIPDASVSEMNNEEVQQTGYLSGLGSASNYIPQGVTNYFGGSAKSTGSDSETRPRHSNGAAAEPDDETASTTTDLTELSTTAQAGSLAPSGAASPASAFSVDDQPTDEPKSNVDEESAGAKEPGVDPSPADSSPFLHEDHASARIPSPARINLAPRTHPLADGDAQHGGFLLRESVQAKLDEERAEGVRSPAYNDAGPSAPFTTRSEDEYSSDEAREDAQGGKVKRLVKRLRGEAKVISGQIRRDPERREEGKNMKRQT
ncbi:hypothetical protein DFH09DRAFT_1310013 [Mycena vulgaris]|nr:hypothetical protein DFH09DRAFT_1310013 [Mycena vulgaris]